MKQFCSTCGESMRKVPERGFKRLVEHDFGVYARYQICPACGEAFCTVKVHCLPRHLLRVPLRTSGTGTPSEHPVVVILNAQGTLQALGDAMKANGWHGQGEVVAVTECQEMNEVSRTWFTAVSVVWGPRTTVKIRPVPFTPEEEETYQRFLDVWEFKGTTGLVPCPCGQPGEVQELGGSWWKRRAIPRNRCTALVPAGFWNFQV